MWVGTRFIATHEARAVPGYEEAIRAIHEDDTVVTRAYTGKTCRVVRNAYTQAFDDEGAAPQPFPGQVIKSMQDGANHLGEDEHATGVDPDREFFPAGQGAGAIDDLVSATELAAASWPPRPPSTGSALSDRGRADRRGVKARSA